MTKVLQMYPREGRRENRITSPNLLDNTRGREENKTEGYRMKKQAKRLEQVATSGSLRKVYTGESRDYQRS